jgi:hypothetical protein
MTFAHQFLGVMGFSFGRYTIKDASTKNLGKRVIWCASQNSLGMRWVINFQSVSTTSTLYPEAGIIYKVYSLGEVRYFQS